MNAHTPITAKRPTTDLLADQKPDAQARLKVFDEAVQAAFDKLNDDPAYADCDEELNKLFRKFNALKGELVAQCGQYLKGQVPQRPMPYREWAA